MELSGPSVTSSSAKDWLGKTGVLNVSLGEGMEASACCIPEEYRSRSLSCRTRAACGFWCSCCMASFGFI